MTLTAEIGIVFMLILATGFIVIEIKGLIDSKKREDKERMKRMNKDRAIEIFENIRNDDNILHFTHEEHLQAIDYAIEQMEKLEKIKAECEKINEWKKSTSIYKP